MSLKKLAYSTLDKTLNQTICSVWNFYLKHMKLSFFFSFYSFVTYSFVRCCIVLILLAITTNLWQNLLWWAMSNIKMTLDHEEVRWWWYGIRGRACESGWSVCDSIWKVPSVRHLEESHGGRSQKVLILGHLGCDLPCDFPRDARHLELSVCYHKHSSHFCTLLLLSHTITISLPHHQESLRRCSSLIKVSFVIN